MGQMGLMSAYQVLGLCGMMLLGSVLFQWMEQGAPRRLFSGEWWAMQGVLFFVGLVLLALVSYCLVMELLRWNRRHE
ncbi:hypothetical protein UFOVP672_46 [uncultured Caudovirales phage]|uniref:Uncharacterized protein n=1 Tax=uncultured Caudovirales phage TaxID=2100421 RepID=A0A6J5NGT1_9CAUD|nr:hypothetical protein UFOVP672_46 [uncultured Caudovirales phage]